MQKKVRNGFGCFSDDDLDEIWSGEEYVDVQDELIALMKEFEVCYELTGKKGKYIAPHLLKVNPPTYPVSWNSQDNLILTYRYAFKPRNVFPRLIVALHGYIESQTMVWKHGAIFSNAENGSRAEVIEDNDYHKADIRIRISGSGKEQWLYVIGHEIQRINDSFNCLEYEVLIPCNCTECKGNQEPEEYPYTVLRNALRKRQYKVQCRKSFESVEVRRLIDDVMVETDYVVSGVNVEKTDYLLSDTELIDAKSPFSAQFNNCHVTYQPQQYQESTTMSTQINQFGKGDNIAGDKIQTQINSNPDLAQAARDIKALLDELSEEYNPNSAKGQTKIKEAALAQIQQILLLNSVPLKLLHPQVKKL